jgi:hypothetical protein
MKKLTFLIVVVISVLSFSCEKLEDLTVGIVTTLEADMPVISQKSDSIDPETEVYSFVGGGIFTLTDNQEIEKYFDNIDNIEALAGSLIQFNGVSEGNKILTLKMKYGIQATPDSQPAIHQVFSFSGQLMAKDGVIKYLNDSWSKIIVSAMEANKDKIFAIQIEGTANYNINVPVKIEVPVKLNTKPLQSN